MIFDSAQSWRDAPHRRILLFGMSGLGKTHVSNLLRAGGNWFHYSVDYRIGTRYLGEHIADNFKSEAMKSPVLGELLRSDSISVASNITFNNLTPLSAYLGKPGDPNKNGLPWEEYQRRQKLHAHAERDAMRDCEHFIRRAQEIYGYPHFVCDSSGSIVEVTDPSNPDDPILTKLSQMLLPIWIEGTEAHTQKLIMRFDRQPKPMYYNPEFLMQAWKAYLEEQEIAPENVDPDAFVRWTFARALAHRLPRYRALAENWGVSIPADALGALNTPEEFTELVAEAIERKKAA